MGLTENAILNTNLIKNYKNTGYDKIVFKILTIKIVTVSFSI